MTVWRRAKGSKGHPLQSSWNLLSHRIRCTTCNKEISSSLPWLLCQLAPVPLWSGQKQQPTSKLSDVLHLAGSPASSRRGAIRYSCLSFEPLLSSLGLTFAPSSSRYSQTSLVHTAGGEWRCQTILVATHSFPKNWNWELVGFKHICNGWFLSIWPRVPVPVGCSLHQGILPSLCRIIQCRVMGLHQEFLGSTITNSISSFSRKPSWPSYLCWCSRHLVLPTPARNKSWIIAPMPGSSSKV